MAYLLPLVLCSILSTPAERTNNAVQKPVVESDRIENAAGVNGESAIQIASKRAARKYKSLNRYNIALCDMGDRWRVIFELKDPRSDGRGPEYTIVKRGGAILHIEVSAHRLAASGYSKAAPSKKDKQLSRDEAIALARDDALKTYGSLSDLNVSACELIGAWYVVFYFREPLMRGGAPLYIIDKKTGKIIENRFYT